MDFDVDWLVGVGWLKCLAPAGCEGYKAIRFAYMTTSVILFVFLFIQELSATVQRFKLQQGRTVESPKLAVLKVVFGRIQIK